MSDEDVQVHTRHLSISRASTRRADGACGAVRPTAPQRHGDQLLARAQAFPMCSPGGAGDGRPRASTRPAGAARQGLGGSSVARASPTQRGPERMLSAGIILGAKSATPPTGPPSSSGAAAGTSATEHGRRHAERCDAPLRDRSRAGQVALRAKLPAAGAGLVRVAILRRLKSAGKGSRFERCDVPPELWRGLGRDASFRWELALEGPGAWEVRKQYLVRLRCEHESGMVWETHADKATAIETNGVPSRAAAAPVPPPRRDPAASALALPGAGRAAGSTKRPLSGSSPPSRVVRNVLSRQSPGAGLCGVPAEAQPRPLAVALAEPVAASPMGRLIEDRLATLERRAFDALGTGGIFRRMSALEEAIFPESKRRAGTPSQRCAALEAELGFRVEPENLD